MTAAVEFMAGAEGFLLVVIINCIGILALMVWEARP